MSGLLSRRDAISNHETRTVEIWWMNEQHSYSLWQEMARYSWRTAGMMSAVHSREDRREVATGLLAEQMKDAVEADAEQLPGGLLSDLLRGAILEVNWHAVAEAWIEEIYEEDCDVNENDEGGEPWS